MFVTLIKYAMYAKMYTSRLLWALGLSWFVSLVGYGQQASRNATSNEPHYANLFFRAGGFAVVDPEQQYAVGIRPAIDYYGRKAPFALHFALERSITDSRDSDAEDATTISANEVQRYQRTTAGTTLLLFDKVLSSVKRIDVYNSKSTKSTETTVPFEVRMLMGIRGGWQQEKYTLGLVDATDGTITAADGTVFGEGAQASNQGNVFVPVENNMIYFGGSITTFRGLIVDLNKYTSKSNYALFAFYADVLFTLNNTLDLLEVGPIQYDLVSTGASGFDESNLGYRAGIEFITGRRFGATFTVEGGKRPGLGENLWYVKAGIGLSLHGNTIDPPQRK